MTDCPTGRRTKKKDRECQGGPCSTFPRPSSGKSSGDSSVGTRGDLVDHHFLRRLRLPGDRLRCTVPVDAVSSRPDHDGQHFQHGARWYVDRRLRVRLSRRPRGPPPCHHPGDRRVRAPHAGLCPRRRLRVIAGAASRRRGRVGRNVAARLGIEHRVRTEALSFDDRDGHHDRLFRRHCARRPDCKLVDSAIRVAVAVCRRRCAIACCGARAGVDAAGIGPLPRQQGRRAAAGRRLAAPPHRRRGARGSTICRR